MKRLFLFDLDGTLVNTSGAGTRSLDHVFRELYGVTGVLDQVKVHGKTDPAIFREAIRTFFQRDPQPGESDLFFRRYLEVLAQEVQRPGAKGVLAGVRELLADLSGRSDAVLALGTGNLERGARLKLSPYGLNDYFPIGGFGSDAEDRAEVLRFGHRRAVAHAGTNINASDVWVIGDTPHDVTAARAAGFRVMAVATGSYPLEDLEALSPDHALSDLTHAPAWLRSMGALVS